MRGQGLFGLPLIVQLPAPMLGSPTATLRGPRPFDETSTAGTLCVVDRGTYRTTDPVYGPSGSGALAADNVVFLIPLQPLLPGSYTASFRAPGEAPVRWSFTEAASYVLSQSEGSPEHEPPGHRFDEPLQVLVDDGAGVPVPGVPVRFAIVSGSARFVGGGSQAMAASGPSGEATAPALVAGQEAGIVRIVAWTKGAHTATSLTVVVTGASSTSTTVPVPPGAPRLRLSAGREAMAPGTAVVFTLTAVNPGRALGPVTVSLEVPHPLAVGAHSPGATRRSVGGLLTDLIWSAAGLGAGGELTYRVRMTVPATAPPSSATVRAILQHRGDAWVVARAALHVAVR